MAVSKRLRFEVMRRDNHACRYCGAKAPEVKLTIDHVIPVALGGNDEPSNLVTACADCNSGKSSVSPDQPLVDDVEADTIRWAKAMKQAAEIVAAQREEKRKSLHHFQEHVWATWTQGPNQEPIPLPPDWRESVSNFLDLGIPMAILHDCVDVACGNSRIPPDSTFRYMCGVAWKKVDALQKAAREIIEAEASPDGA